MTKRFLIFSIIQIISLLLSFFILALALVGSHGSLYFSDDGGKVALIITIILSLPLLYLFTQRNKLQNKRRIVIIAILIFILSLGVVYVGLPGIAKQFIVDKSNTNVVSIYNDSDFTVDFKLEEEMFDRIGIEASFNKTSNIELTKFDLTVYNNKREVINPAFQLLAWDSLHHETIKMNSFFESNKHTKQNSFALTGQYSIKHTNSLHMQIDYAFNKNGQPFFNSKKIEVDIKKRLVLDRLIEY